VRVLLIKLSLAVVLAAFPLVAASATMDEEIDALLAAVSTSECVFIRNGKEYDVEKAVSHLQMKRKRGGRYFSTTEEFIENIASKSSFSGRPYEIRCGDDAPQRAGDWFNDRLQEIRK
jgi:hypothetical protein